jgi:hypothetical protein
MRKMQEIEQSPRPEMNIPSGACKHGIPPHLLLLLEKLMGKERIRFMHPLIITYRAPSLS